MAFIPGPLVFLLVFGGVTVLLVLAFRAPTGDIVDWEATPPRWDRWASRLRGVRPARGGAAGDQNQEGP
jgi:hypothetical protein